MKHLFALVLLLLISGAVFAGGDETAPMIEKEFKYKDWTFKNIAGGADVNLRTFAKDKKLVLVVYFAAWCPNWHKESPVVQRLYEKYKTQGFDVVAVGEYETLEKTKKNIDDNKFTFTVVTESVTTDAKQKTEHFAYRQKAGDVRNWGSPWNLFLETDKIKKDGDTLVSKAFVVNGEIIEAEVETFIRKKLGLKTETAPLKTAKAAKVK